MRTVAILAGQLVVGGAERQLYLWLTHMDRRRFQPVVVTLHPGSGDYWEPVIESMDIPLLRVSRRRNRLARLAEIVGLLEPYAPDLIHSWHLFPSPYAGAAAKWLGAQSSLGSLRGSFESFRKNRFESLLTLGLTDGMVVNSEAAARRLADHYQWLNCGVHVIPNAVEDEIEDRQIARRDWSERWSIPDSNFWVGSLGRFDPLKRFDLFLEAAAKLRQQIPALSVLLIGYGPQFKELHAKAESLGIGDCVVFTGAEPEARRKLSALDAFCFPSMDEGMPNVVLEAAMASVPVVAWRTPFLEELLDHGKSALLVERRNVDQLSLALRTVAEDPALGRTLGQAARERILTHFGLNRFVERLTRVYESLLPA